MVKWAFQARSDDDAFGLLFENVTGSEFRLATGIPVHVHSVLLLGLMSYANVSFSE